MFFLHQNVIFIFSCIMNKNHSSLCLLLYILYKITNQEIFRGKLSILSGFVKTKMSRKVKMNYEKNLDSDDKKIAQISTKRTDPSHLHSL